MSPRSTTKLSTFGRRQWEMGPGDDSVAAGRGVESVAPEEDQPRATSLGQRARDRGSEWVQGAASYFFVSARDEPRIRRLADGFSLLVAAALVGVSAQADAAPSVFLDNLTATVASLPSPLQNLLIASFAVGMLYAIALLLAALIRWRLAVFRDLLLAAAGALIVAMVIGRLVAGEWPALGSIGSLLGKDETVYPVTRLAVMSAVLLTAAPHLGRPYRRFGQLLVLIAAFAAVALGFGVGADVIAAVSVGWAVAALTHLVFGSPSGAPPTIRVKRALQQLGVDTADLEPLPERHGGVAFHRGRTTDDRQFLVKVYGRDAISTRLVTRLWRHLWHRGSSLDPTASRRELVEHEALAGLLAGRAGVRVPELLAVGVAHPKDALIAYEWAGRAVADLDADTVTDGHLTSAWSSLAQAHDVGIAHGGLDPIAVRIDGDEALLADWSMSSTEAAPEDRTDDAAALLVTTALTVGSERAISAALTHLGSGGLEAALSYVQPAALDDRLRRAIKDSDFDLDGLRVSAAAATGTEPPELTELRRVSIGKVLMLVLIAIATWGLITAITNVGLANLIDYIAEGNVFWLLVAFVFGQTPQIAQAISVQGSISFKLAFVPLINQQFAIGFLSLAAPGTAVQVAANTRFLQKQGASVPAALTAGALVAVARFLVQLALVLSLVLADVVDLGLKLDISPSGFNTTILWVVLGVIIGCVVILVRVPKYRARAGELWRVAARGVREGVHSLRSLRQVGQLFGGQLASEVLLAMTLGIVAHAYGASLGLATLVVIQSGTALINGFAPVPGGIGVWELLLTTALVAAGIPKTNAIAIAISYRVVTFYLPPIWGWFSLRWLRHNDYM